MQNAMEQTKVKYIYSIQSYSKKAAEVSNGAFPHPLLKTFPLHGKSHHGGDTITPGDTKLDRNGPLECTQCIFK